MRIGPRVDRQTVHQPDAAFVERRQRLSRLLAMLMLVPAAPAIAVLVVLTRLTSEGPGIYRQRRVGYRGREFVMLKIRTMRQNAEAESGPVWAAKNDCRATFLGKFLRRVHLDELPQLLNVVRGEMCLVGPRPERPEIVARLRQQVPGYDDRLAVPPGIAGLAQLRQGADVDLETVMAKQSLDLAYISRVTSVPFLDLRILLATGLMVVGFTRETATKTFGLDRLQPVAIAEPSAASIAGRQAA